MSEKKKVTWVDPDEPVADATQPNAGRDDGAPKRGKHWSPFHVEPPREEAPVRMWGGLPVYEFPAEGKKDEPPTIAKVVLPPPTKGLPSASRKSVDATMVGEILSVMVKNETARTWYADQCFPGAYWQFFGERMNGPSTKSQHLAYNVDPGGIVSFRVVVPRLPEGTPHELVIAVLENGVAWYEVMRIPFR